MESTGMVVKIKGKSCIVLTPDGEFREVSLPKGEAPKLGREIRLEKRNKLPALRYFMVAASFLICVLAGQFYLGQVPPAAAYLTIDINPSIELAVAADRKIVSTRGLNSDGDRILAEVKVKGRDLRNAVELIVAQAIVDQYLKQNEDNVILATLTVGSDAGPLLDLESIFEAIQNPVDSGGVEAEVVIEPVAPEMRQEAEKSGISTGRYLLLQKSGKKGVPVSVSEISAISLGKLEKDKKVSIIRLLEEDSNEHEGGDALEGKDGEVSKRGIYKEHNSSKKENGSMKENGSKKENGRKQNDETDGNVVFPGSTQQYRRGEGANGPASKPQKNDDKVKVKNEPADRDKSNKQKDSGANESEHGTGKYSREGR